MNALSDTTLEAQRVWVDVFRGYSPAKKWLLLGQTFRTAQALHAAGYRQTHADAQPSAISHDWLKRNFDYRNSQTRSAMAEPLSNLQVLREVISVLTQLQIPHALGGSMASSLHGIARLTLDADIAAEPFPEKIPAFVAAFGPDYYLSQLAMEDAHRLHASFNLINTEAGFKVDIFIRPDEPFAQNAMARRQSVAIGDDNADPISVQSAEDVILYKLLWYRLAQQSTDQQWKDVQGMLTVKAGGLDEQYLDQWAATLQVTELLARARTAARA